MLGAIVLFPVASADITLQLYAVRLVSVLLAALVVVTTFLTAETLFPDDKLLAIGIPSFVVFLPAHTFMTSTVNNDHLAEFFVSLLVFVLVKSFKNGLSLSKAVAIMFLFVLGLLAKRTAVIAIPLIIIAVPLYAWADFSRVIPSRKRLSLSIGVLSLVAVLAVSFWNAWRPLLHERILEFADWAPIGYPASILFYRGNFTTLFASLTISRLVEYGQMMFETFWARFGWLTIRLDDGLYQLLALISVAAVNGLVLLTIRVAKKSAPLTLWQQKCLLLFFLSVFSSIVIVGIYRIALSAYYITIQLSEPALPQGRYLFPLIIPIATLFMVGLRALVPSRYYKTSMLVCIGGFIILDLVSLVGYIVPYFYL